MLPKDVQLPETGRIRTSILRVAFRGIIFHPFVLAGSLIDHVPNRGMAFAQLADQNQRSADEPGPGLQADLQKPFQEGGDARDRDVMLDGPIEQV